MSKDGKPVTKTLADGRLSISYDDVPDAKEANLGAPLPERKTANTGEGMKLVGDGERTRPATKEELKALTAKAVAIGTVTRQADAKSNTPKQIGKSIVDLIEKANKISPKPSDVEQEDIDTHDPKQDEVSEDDAVEALKPAGLKMRAQGSGYSPTEFQIDDEKTPNQPFGVANREDGTDPDTTVVPLKTKKPHYSGAPAEGVKEIAKQPNVKPTKIKPGVINVSPKKKSMVEGDKVYVPALKSTGIITKITKSFVDVAVGKRIATVGVADVMPIIKHETLVAHDHNEIASGDVPLYTGVADDEGGEAEEDRTETSEDEAKDEASKGAGFASQGATNLNAGAPSAGQVSKLTPSNGATAYTGGQQTNVGDGKNLPLKSATQKSIIQRAIEKHQQDPLGEHDHYAPDEHPDPEVDKENSPESKPASKTGKKIAGHTAGPTDMPNDEKQGDIMTGKVRGSHNMPPREMQKDRQGKA